MRPPELFQKGSLRKTPGMTMWCGKTFNGWAAYFQLYGCPITQVWLRRYYDRRKHSYEETPLETLHAVYTHLCNRHPELNIVRPAVLEDDGGE